MRKRRSRAGSSPCCGFSLFLVRGGVSLAVLAGLALAFFAVGHDGRLPWQPEPTHGKDWCDTHQVPLSTDDKCNPSSLPGDSPSPASARPRTMSAPTRSCGSRCRRRSPSGWESSLDQVQPRAVSESLKTTAETAYPPTKYARVAPRITGIVRDVKAVVGQQVEAGAVLAVVEAPEMSQAATTYRQAVGQMRLREKTHAQEKEASAEKKISAGHDLLAASAGLTRRDSRSRRRASTC